MSVSSILCCCLVAWLCRTLCDPMTVNLQALLSMSFPRQEYWSGLPFLLQEIFPTQGSSPSLMKCKQILYLSATREALQAHLDISKSEKMFAISGQSEFIKRQTGQLVICWSVGREALKGFCFPRECSLVTLTCSLLLHLTCSLLSAACDSAESHVTPRQWKLLRDASAGVHAGGI